MRGCALLALAACHAAPTPVPMLPRLSHDAPVEAPLAKPADSVRYTLPSCPLTYHVLTRELNTIDDSPGFDTERFMNLQATNVNGRMQLDLSLIHI